jgi:hypothetical protein
LVVDEEAGRGAEEKDGTQPKIQGEKNLAACVVNRTHDGRGGFTTICFLIHCYRLAITMRANYTTQCLCCCCWKLPHYSYTPVPKLLTGPMVGRLLD